MNKSASLACVGFLIFVTNSAAIAAEDVLKYVDTKVSGCQKLVFVQTEKNWLALGMMGVKGASCPANFNGRVTVQTKMIDSHTVELETGARCVFDDNGRGKCK